MANLNPFSSGDSANAEKQVNKKIQKTMMENLFIFCFMIKSQFIFYDLLIKFSNFISNGGRKKKSAIIAKAIVIIDN